MGSLFTWDAIDQNAPKVPGALKRRLEDIDSVQVLPAEEGTVAATKRARQKGYQQAVKTLGKYQYQALRPLTQPGPVTFGDADPSATAGEDLTAPVIARNDLDTRLNTLLESVAHTKEGSKKFMDMAGTEELSQRQKADLVREAKGVLFREYQRNKRLKKIKSKAFRKHKRADLEKTRAKTLERLEEEDPEAAAKLREEYQVKRAELRMEKAHRARRRWAQMAARFGGKDTVHSIQSQFQAERDNKELLNKLAGKKSMDHSDSDGTDTDSTTDDEDDEGLTKEQRLANLVEKTAGELADVIEGPNDLIPQGIRSMKFMQRGEERRKAELAKEAETFLELLQEGFSEHDAKQMAKERLKDDFVQGANDLPEVEQKSIQLAMQKREALNKRKAEAAAETGQSQNVCAGDDASPYKDQDRILDVLNAGTRRASAEIDTRSAHQRGKKVTFSLEGEDAAVEREGGEKSLKSMITTVDPVAILGPQSKEAEKTHKGTQDQSEAQIEDPSLASNEALVDMAFALTNTNVEEFHAQQESEATQEWEALQAQQPQNGGGLPGWGSWTGEGVRKVQKLTSPTRPVVQKRSAVYNLDGQRKTIGLFSPAKLASEFRDPSQHNALMSQPIGQEWLPNGTFQKLIEPRVKVRAGSMVPAMKHKGPKHLRKGL